MRRDVDCADWAECSGPALIRICREMRQARFPVLVNRRAVTVKRCTGEAADVGSTRILQRPVKVKQPWTPKYSPAPSYDCLI